MKSAIAKISTAIVLVAAASSACAQFYGELGYTALSYKESGAPDADLGLLGATIGYEINKNLAVEGLLATGISDDTVQVGAVNVKVKNKDTYGFFLKPKAIVAENLEVSAKLGWAKSKIEASSLGVTASDSGSDFAYGVGVQYSVTPTAYITGGYSNFYNKDGTKVDGWNIGVGYKF